VRPCDEDTIVCRRAGHAIKRRAIGRHLDAEWWQTARIGERPNGRGYRVEATAVSAGRDAAQFRKGQGERKEIELSSAKPRRVEECMARVSDESV